MREPEIFMYCNIILASLNAITDYRINISQYHQIEVTSTE